MRLLAKSLGLAAAVLTTALLVLPAPALAAANPKPKIDFNSDGKADIATIDGDHLYFRHGRGNGTFSLPYYIGSGWTNYWEFVAPGDINGDSKADLVAINKADNCLYRWYGNGRNGFATRARIGCGWLDYRALTGPGDLNGDSKPDLLAIKLGDGNCLYRWFGNGKGGFGSGVRIGCGWSPYWYQLVGPGDADGDGKADLVAINNDNSCSYMWPGTGTGYFGTARKGRCFDNSGTEDLTAPGDVNGDGRPDILRINESGCLLRSSYPYFYLESQVDCNWWHGRQLAR